MSGMLARIARMDAHHRLASGSFAAVATGLALHSQTLSTALLAAFDVFALVSLILLAIAVAFTSAQQIRELAKKQDVGRTVIFVFVIMVACVAVFAVAFLIRGGKNTAGTPFNIHLGLAVTTVVLSWLLTHMVFALRYAHNFYGDDNARDAKKGLEFPGEKRPDYRDFAYFSFVIGMTCQVSDVQVTSREMRRLVLLHGVLSFAFNTVILAFTVNTVSSLL